MLKTRKSARDLVQEHSSSSNVFENVDFEYFYNYNKVPNPSISLN